jgi:hypothetical protein
MVQARCGFSARAIFLRHGSISAFPARLRPSDPFGMCTFGEDLACKSEEASLGIAPSFAAQPCLAAGLFQELLARQPMFDRNLGEKNPALCV